MKNKFAYLASQAIDCWLTRPICPNCGSASSRVIDRKYVVSQLRKCDQCYVNFRYPADREDTSITFYQRGYQQKGLTTELPAQKELDHLLATGFRGSEKDFSHYVNFLKDLTSALGWDVAKIDVLDYGANWGYFLWQLAAHGFKGAVGLEVSDPRRGFGETSLGMRYIKSDSLRPKSLDVFISMHVIEHLPRPDLLLDLAGRCLRPGGILIIECPNGSSSARSSLSWSAQWGKVHPFYISDEYLVRRLERHGFTGSVLDPEALMASRDSRWDDCWEKRITQALRMPLNSRFPTKSSLLFVGQKLDES